jgi:methyl-accepting chemotaxis protein
MDQEITAFLIRTTIVGALLIGFLYWRFKDALLTKVMVSITPFLLIMSTSSYLNAKLGKSVPWLAIAGPVTVIGVGILSILFVNKYARTTLNQLLRQLRGVAGELSGTSQAIAQRSEALNDGAGRQERSVAETEQALTLGMKAVESALQVSKRALAQSEEAQRNLIDGLRIMSEFQAAISRIDENATRSGGIVKTIEGIALQTNILSLNAAVEAQRAGSAGQGFAVVADEVRTLAGKVTLSTKDINNLMDDTKKHSRSGSELADKLQRVIRQFETSINGFNETVQELSAQSEQQREVMLQIHHGIHELVSIAGTLQAAGDSSRTESETLLHGIERLTTAQRELEVLVNGTQKNA